MARLMGVLLTIATLTATLPTGASAQTPGSTPDRSTSDPGAVEYLLVRQQFGSEDGRPVALDGVGGRVLWSLAPLIGAEDNGLLSRTSVGAFLVHTPESNVRTPLEAWHYGAQLDLRLMEAPIAGRIDPLVSLGFGAMHIEEPGRRSIVGPGIQFAQPPERRVLGGIAMPVVRPELPRVETTIPARTRTSMTVTPGIGARLELLPGINLRSDLSMILDLEGDLPRTTELTGGISLSV